MADDDNNVDNKPGQINKIITTSLTAHPSSELTSAKTATVISSLTSGTQVSSSPSGITSFQLRQHFISTPLGLRLANSAVAVPVQNVSSQRVTNPSTNIVTQGNNVQVPKQGIPLVNANAGTGQLTFHPRIANPGFTQTIPISTTLIGQPVALQRFPSKGHSISVQRLPTGSVMPVSSQQILRNGTSQGAGKVQLTRQGMSPGNVTNLQTPKSPTVSTIVGANHVSYRVPSPQTQQVTVQRIVSPVVAQQAGGVAQSQIVSNPTNLVQGPGTQANTVSLHGQTPLGTTTILAGQPFTIQPRPQGTLIAGSVSSPLTLTVTSISPGSAIISSSSSAIQGISQPSPSQVQQVQQFIQRPGVVISQSSVLRSGIPVVLPRTALTLTGGHQQVLQGTVPRIIQRPLVSPAGSCGGQVTMHLPSVVGPVIKTPVYKPSATTAVTSASTTATSSKDQMSQIEKTSSSITATTVPSSVNVTEEPPSSTASLLISSSLPLSTSSQASSTLVSSSTPSLISQAILSATPAVCSTTMSESSILTSSSICSLVPVSSTPIISSDIMCSEKSPISVTSSDVASVANISGTNTITETTVMKESQKSENNSNKGVDKELEKPAIVTTESQAPTANTNTTKSTPVSTTSTVDMSTISVLPSNLTSLGARSTTFPVTSESTGESANNESSGNQGAILTQGFIDSNLLEWDDKIGTLPGTDMRFKINEFGVLELVEDSGQQDTASEPNQSGEPVAEENGTDDSKVEEEDKKEVSAVNDPGELSEHEGDPICCCVYCGRYGYKSNFRTGRFCSQTCAGKKNMHRKQIIMSRLVMGMKKGKKKMNGLGDNNVSNGSGEDKKNLSFDWDAYLSETGAIGAPKRLFKEPFPTSSNGFKLRMRLEGIDPKHQALFCVLSVAEISGYRLRLHFDGYSECYDFWVNADSPFIFPVGWAEKNGKTLQPPKGISISEFNWTTYLKQMRAVAAPKHLFTNQPASVTPSAFRVNMKLEAVDKKNSALVCVSSVADTLGDKVLIHFDGWEDVYDYWCDITSPNIHSVGWCKQNKKTLSAPPDHSDMENFTWDRYLSDTKTSAVPSRAFKARSPMGFEAGMKLEVTDKRNPILIRVASVKKVKHTRLLIHFNGWDDIYDYWVDDDSPDLHPPNWCMKTGHSLQIPIDKENTQSEDGSGGCPTRGCKGIGHMKGAKYAGHHSEFGCPYSATNMSKDTCLADRLGSSRSEESGASIIRHDYHGDIRRCPTPGCNGLGHVTGKFTSHHCVSGCPLAEKNLMKTKQEAGIEPRPVGRPGRGRKRKIFGLNNNGPSEKVIKTEPPENSSEEVNLFRASVHESVFQSEAAFPPPRDQPLCWNDHAKLLPGVDMVDGDSVGNWSVEDVANFILQLTGQEDQAQRFKEEQIDGDSFLLLQQSDLVNFLNIKLGPAVKIFNSIQVFKAAMDNVL